MLYGENMLSTFQGNMVFWRPGQAGEVWWEWTPVSTRSNVFQNRGPDEPGTLAPRVELKPLIFSSSHFPTLTNIKVLVRSVAPGVTRGSSSLTTLTACLERDPCWQPRGPLSKKITVLFYKRATREKSLEAGLMSASTRYTQTSCCSYQRLDCNI